MEHQQQQQSLEEREMEHQQQQQQYPEIMEHHHQQQQQQSPRMFNTPPSQSQPTTLVTTEQIQKVDFKTNVLTTVSMICGQIVYAAIAILYKYAFQHGISLRVIIAYRLALASVLLMALAYAFYWRGNPGTQRLTWRVLRWSLFCGILREFVGSNLYVLSLNMGSTTTATAIQNLGPAATFFLAVVLRRESVDFQTWAGKAKVVGTILAICGATVSSVYKGPILNIWPESWKKHEDLTSLEIFQAFHKSKPNQGVSAFLAVLSCLAAVTAGIIQDKIVKELKSITATSALIVVMGAIPSVIMAAVMEREAFVNLWRVPLAIIIVPFAGLVGAGVFTMGSTWCMQQRGVFFVSIFTPLTLILVSLASPLVLSEEMHLGSAIGGAIIIVGVILVLGGKKKEEDNMRRARTVANVQEGP